MMPNREYSVVIARTVDGSTTLAIPSECVNIIKDEAIFLPAAREHRITQSWKKQCIGESIAKLLDAHKFSILSIDCIRKPQLFAYLKRCLRETPVLENDSHTLVITLAIMPTDYLDLEDVMQEIHWELVDGLTVEVRVGKLNFFGRSVVGVGSSISLQYDISQHGTIGGCVNVINEQCQTVGHCVLTCEHIVRPYISVANETDVMQPQEKYSEPYFCDARGISENQLITCIVPSSASTTARIHRTRRDYTLLAAETLVYKFNRGQMFPAYELDELRQNRMKLRMDVNRLISREEVRGTVYASSGYSFSRHGHRLDWALVKVDPSYLLKTRRNKLPRANNSLHEPSQILDFTKPQPLAEVCKYGSSTGTTTGIINPIQSCVVSYSAAGERRFTMEWCVVSSDFRDGSAGFANLGDSGAFVLEQGTSRVMGMIFGGHANGGLVYFTSITAIATHVMQLTGLCMRLPGGRIIAS